MLYMALPLIEPALSVLKVQTLFHYFDSAKRKLERLTLHMLNGVRAFSKLNPAFASIAVYSLCIGAGFMMWIAMGFLDLAVGTRVLEATIQLIEGLDKHVLPALQLLNGLLALLLGFSMLMRRLNINLHIIINGNSSRINQYNISTSSRRSKMIRVLPKAKYGSLRRPDDAERNDSSCAICLSCIAEDDGVRILPNCRHYFHISCIDRWLLQCPTNSSCPLCRATVIDPGSSQAQ